MEIEYIKVGDYYIPNLVLPQESREIGYWGMLRKNYLKEHKSGWYQYMVLSCKIDTYLADLNEQAEERFDLIEKQLREAEGVTEELKAADQMKWVRSANNIRHRAAEIVKHEMIYV
jgi:predicted alpha-1,6-mannanase (GH76 family)